MVAWAASQDCDALCRQMSELLDQMEEGLAAQPHSGGAFLVAEGYTLADVVATSFCARVHLIKGNDLFGPHVAKYWARMQARPSYQKAHLISDWEGALMARQIAAAAEGQDPMALDVDWAEGAG